jgi:hypothetical protein
MKRLPSAVVIRAARFARTISRTAGERMLSGALFAYLDDPASFRSILGELESARDYVALTERAMALQLVHDRETGGPALRGPFYEEGEIVRHLERGDEQLVRRHLRIATRDRV